MANYYIDTEFHEYHKQVKVFGIPINKPIPTIDLISIGIVSEDGREYYAISKDFNIKDAWNSYQIEMPSGDMRNRYPSGIKVYWLRENVLKPIFRELLIIDGKNSNIVVKKYYKYPTNGIGLNDMIINEIEESSFTYKNFKRLVNKYGKTNKQIAEEIIGFVANTNESQFCKNENNKYDIIYQTSKRGETLPLFYAYYADYDWVVFAQLFGKMIDLPEGFPKYCRDLKQIFDEKIDNLNANDITVITEIGLDENKGYTNDIDDDFNKKSRIIRESKHYPKQENKHNALYDAKWNKKLYEFLEKIKLN